MLVNLYNPNTEPEQLETLYELETILLKFDDNEYNHVIFSGDFNIFFKVSLEATGGNTKLKRRTVGKFLELKDKFNLYDIWRRKHLKLKPLPSDKNIFLVLNYIFVLQSDQQRKRKVDILNGALTDHLPVFCSLWNNTEFYPKGPGIWKLNNCSIFNRNFVKEMKFFIHDTKKRRATKDVFGEQSQWEILKCEIRKLSTRYSKVIFKEKEKSITS